MDYKTKKCVFCGADFKPATANARYCSDKCRKAVAKQNSLKQAQQRKFKKQIAGNSPPVDPSDIPATVPFIQGTPTPPETPAPPETVPPTETTTPLRDDSKGEGESGSKPFRGFFYD